MLYRLYLIGLFVTGAASALFDKSEFPLHLLLIIVLMGCGVILIFASTENGEFAVSWELIIQGLIVLGGAVLVEVLRMLL